MSWYAVHTQPHAESRAVEHLTRQGYQVYLPRYRRWVRHARQRRIVQRPLFPRYIFAHFDRATTPWRPILSTVGVSGLVCGGDGPAPVAAEIIANLRQRESAGAFDELAPAQRLRAGDRVRILEGPFENCLGRLVAASDQERVFILFELLGRTVRAEVSTAAIEAA
jgi:transcriptional antiterminator RfaH